MNEIVIKLSKCVLILYENEIFNGLKPDILTEALKRGKGYKRATKSRIRNETVSQENENFLTGRN
jgi:hypothetical protein